METRKLIEKYEAGLCSQEEIRMIEGLIEQGELDPMEIKTIAATAEKVRHLEFPEASSEMDMGFYERLSSSKKRSGSFSLGIFDRMNFGTSWLAIGVYSILLFVVGFLVSERNDHSQELVSQIGELKEVMMLNMIEGESTSDRLKAVSLTREIMDVSDQIIDALLKTLNSDPNNNVRLAALEALIQYTNKPEVRTGLVNAISNQDSHIVQVALAEIMVGLQEKRALSELRSLIQREGIPDEVKERVQESINALI